MLDAVGVQRTAAASLLTSAVLLAGCGGDAARTGDATEPLSPRSASPAASRQAPAPTTPGALALVPDDRAATTRLGYADRKRLRGADLPVPAATITAAVLGTDAGDAAIVVGDRRKAFTPGDPPETSVITPVAQSAVQSCLGDALAQTVLGPETMGPDSAIGAGLALSTDAPKGAQLRICAAPLRIRQLHATEDALEARFGKLRGTLVAENEIGEREIAQGTVAAERVDPALLRELLAGGDALRDLAPWD